MKKWLLIPVLLCSCVMGQINLLPTTTAGGSNRFHIENECRLAVRGTEDTVTLEWLDLQAVGMVEASLELALRVQDNQSLYVMVTFFDRDSNAVFGQSFYSNYGPTLAGTRPYLQAALLYAKPIGDNRYVLRASKSVFIHQTLIDTTPKAGISPVSYCTVQIFHLMAG